MKVLRIMAVFLIVTIMFSLCSCGKIEEKIAEKSVEKLVENATGANVDITKDGGKIEVNGETMEAGENLPWPEEAMGELPKPKAKVTFVMAGDASKGGTVAVSELELNDAKQYAEKLKEMGFKNGMNLEDSDGIIFSGTTDKGEQVNFVYNLSAKEGTVAYSPAGQNINNGMQSAVANAGMDGGSSDSSDGSYYDQAEAVELPDNYPVNMFPIMSEDKATDARATEDGNTIEFNITVMSKKQMKEIVEYYETQWGNIQDKYKSMNSNGFELNGQIKDYETYIYGELMEDEAKSVQYYITVRKYE